LLEDLKIYKKMITYHDYLRQYRLKSTLFFLFCFEKLIVSNIKNLKLYIEQDSFKKLKGEIYGMGYTSRCSGIGVLFKSVKIFLNKLVLIVEWFWARIY